MDIVERFRLSEVRTFFVSEDRRETSTLYECFWNRKREEAWGRRIERLTATTRIHLSFQFLRDQCEDNELHISTFLFDVVVMAIGGEARPLRQIRSYLRPYLRSGSSLNEQIISNFFESTGIGSFEKLILQRKENTVWSCTKKRQKINQLNSYLNKRTGDIDKYCNTLLLRHRSVILLEKIELHWQDFRKKHLLWKFIRM